MAKVIEEHVKRSGKCDHTFYWNADGDICSNSVAYQSSS